MTNDEREKWHARLDELLKLRERLEEAHAQQAQRLGKKLDEEEIMDAIEYVAAFINDLFGTLIELDPRNFAGPADYIATVLPLWHVAFGNGESANILWRNIFPDLMGLELGEEPVWLRPKPRRPGENARPAKLALARMSALALDVLL